VLAGTKPTPGPRRARRPRARAKGLATLALTALLATGCGSQEDPPNLVNGKRLFTGEGQCAVCHVMKRAGSGGVLGPNLDESFGPARRDGLGESTIENIVLTQIDQTRRGSKMPEDLVTGQDARDVAAYVAQAAGAPGVDVGGLATAGEPLGQTADRGKRIFNASGCGSCHALADVGTSATVGPSLDNLAAASPQPGLTPEEYIRQSIVDPEAFVVPGFPPDGMPSYRSRLNAEEVDAVVAYLTRVTR
jgi:mono/diheme cytochrome c family protein